MYFRGIGDHGLIDSVEGVNASVAAHMLGGENYFVPKIGESLTAGSTMGTWWLMAVALKIFGWGEFATRFWSALSGIGMILLSSLLARSVSVDDDESANPGRRSWLGASLCAGMTACFAVSQIASSHALFSFLISLTLLGVIRAQKERDWLMMAHASIAFAFMIHGPAGLFMPFIAVSAYCVLCNDMELLKDFFTYPFGIIINLVLSGLYLVVLMIFNPQVVFFMFCRNHIYTFGGIGGALIFLFAAFAPFHGFLIQALMEIFPREYPTSKSEELLMLVWALTFGAYAIFSGDVMMIAATIPALSAILAVRLDFWLRGKMLPIRYAVMLNFFILVPAFYILLPLTKKYFPLINGALMSLIPYEFALALFLFASWYYTRTRQIEKWARNVPIAALICLMPAVGVFSLTADMYSIREIGLKLRDTVQGSDIVMQFEVNHPSMYFYTFRNSILINAPLTPGVEERKLTAAVPYISAQWVRRNRIFLLTPADRLNEAKLPGKSVYPVLEIKGLLLMTNK